MNKNVLTVAAALLVSSSAGASLISVDIIAGPTNTVDGSFNTWRVVARFSDAGDQISAVNAVMGLNAIDFYTGDGSDIYNMGAFPGSSLNDFPTSGAPLFGEEWDSYITIGATNFNDNNTQVSPDFLCPGCGGAPPNFSVILGSEFSTDDGAWFFFGAPPLVSDLEDVIADNGSFDVLLFQVGVSDGGFHLDANVQWFNPASGDNNTPFTVDNTPAPGALALLGLAGLAGGRRRRR